MNYTWISDDHRPPNKFIVCPKCGGRIYFNIDELNERKSRGQSTSTPCRFHKENEYHPSFPPEPYFELDGLVKWGGD